MELIDELKELISDLDDDRKRHVIEVYSDSKNESSKFLPSLVKSLRILKGKDDNGADFVGKVTRATFTTSAIISTLLLDKTILVVEPTNAINEKTVNDAFALYIQIAGDRKKKYVRHLSSNRQACSKVIGKNKENKALKKLRYTLSDTKCNGCEIGCYEPCMPTIPPSTEDTCMIQTILKERLPLLKWNGTEYMDNIVEYLVGCGEKWVQNSELELKKMGNAVTISDGKRTATITIEEDGEEKIKATLTTHNGRTYCPVVEKGESDIEISGNIKADVITVTYDKLMLLFDTAIYDNSEKGKRFREIIESAEVCLLDEISTFTQKLIKSMSWHEIKMDWDNGTKKAILDIDMHTEIHRLRNLLKLCGVDSHDKGMQSIFDSFLIPFVDGMKTEIDKSELVSSGYPDSFKNPVNDRREQLLEEETNNALHGALEFAIMHPGVFGLTEDDCVFLDRMLELISAEVFSVLKHENKMGMRVTITPRTQERDIKNLQAAIRELKYKGHLLLTDATLTVDEVEKLIGFDNLNVIHFNDPQNTNEKMLVVNDTVPYRSFNRPFNRYNWDRNPTYCQDVIEKIASYGKYNPLIWCMNKKIAIEVVRELKAHSLEAKILDESTFDTGFAVSWYGSSYSRGMKNKRRIGILLSPAFKPNRCYAETVYCIPKVWNPFDSNDRNRAGAAYDQVHNPYDGITPIIYEDNEQCFFFIADSLQHNNMLADEVQALSRAKDPAGNERSVVICLNWEEKHARELCQQGIYARHDYLTRERYFEDSENLLPTMKFSRNAADIDKWLHGGDIDEYLDFERFADGIDRMLTANRLVVSQEMVIAQLANNSSISVEDARNALTCLVNLNLHFNTFVQTKVNINDPDHMFTKDLTLTDRATAYQNRRSSTGWFFAIESILRAIAESKKEEISLEELKKVVSKIVEPVQVDVDRVLNTMMNWNIFEKSLWNVVSVSEDKVGKRFIMKTNVDEIVLKALEKHAPILAAEGIREIKAWRVHDITGHEIKVIEAAFRRLWKQKRLPYRMKYNPGKPKGNKGGRYAPFIKVL